MATKPRIRRNIVELQNEYEAGDKKPLEDLMRAWRGIKRLRPDNPRSFFTLGGYHGEPFRGAGWGSSAYWGGYCNHGNVLFPTWHRVYLLKLEEALRSVRGCEDVTLPYWDETSEQSQSEGIPWALTQKTFTLDGKTIPNPLRSFKLPRKITDFIAGDNPNYSKPAGYETVRYPLSGLVGTEEDRKATREHNARYRDYDKNVELLNQNVMNWLTESVIVNCAPINRGFLVKRYEDCLRAPNYTVFSNTTSAAQWNNDHDRAPATALESPHNNMHLAVGGFDIPGVFDVSPIAGANGDMGENDTAGLDPIFFFHHCFVDRVFWLWQQRHGFTDNLEIIDQYPGTNSVDSQGPTPGTVPNTWLTLESPLDPFKKGGRRGGRPFTSLDCINIEEQLGYTYGPGSLEGDSPAAEARASGTKVVHVSGINRAPIRGSFLISVFANVGGQRVHVGSEAILSRWNVQYCANCQTHLEARAALDLQPIQPALEQNFEQEHLDDMTFEAELHTRDGVHRHAQGSTGAVSLPTAPVGAQSLRLEVRHAR